MRRIDFYSLKRNGLRRNLQQSLTTNKMVDAGLVSRGYRRARGVNRVELLSTRLSKSGAGGEGRLEIKHLYSIFVSVEGRIIPNFVDADG